MGAAYAPLEHQSCGMVSWCFELLASVRNQSLTLFRDRLLRLTECPKTEAKPGLWRTWSRVALS